MRVTTLIWLVCVISMEFLRSFLRRYFAGLPGSCGVAKCRLFSQAITKVTLFSFGLQERFIGILHHILDDHNS